MLKTLLVAVTKGDRHQCMTKDNVQAQGNSDPKATGIPYDGASTCARLRPIEPAPEGPQPNGGAHNT